MMLSAPPLSAPLIARLVPHADGQAVLLPADVRFEGVEVYLRRDPHTGDVILSARTEPSWREFVALRHGLGALPADALQLGTRRTQHRDPFDTWAE